MNLDRALDDGGLGILDLKAFLQGTWRLSRTMEDRRAGQRGRLDGQAVFAPAGAGLVYRERGMLRLGAFTGPAERVYRYGFARPQRAEVAFEDGSLFHSLELSEAGWRVEHRCRNDLYRGLFRLAAPGAWEAVWLVTGPRKDHRLVTRYNRTG